MVAGKMSSLFCERKEKQFYLASQYERVYACTDAQSFNACPQMRFFFPSCLAWTLW